MLIQPMTALLHKHATWDWCEKYQSDKVLVHYNPELPIILACDESPYGVGSVISYKM